MTRRDARQAGRRCLVTAGLLLSSPGFTELPPVRVFGHLGYEFRYDQFEQGDDRMEHGATLRLGLASYLWQPWFAQIDGGLNLKYTTSQQQSRDRSGTFITGDARLRLFPLSRFPAEIFYEQRQDNIDDELFDTDTELTRYGFSQRYTTTSGTALRLRYEHNERTFGRDVFDRDQIDVNDIVQFSAGTNFSNLSLNFDSTYNRLEQEDTGDQTTRWFSVLRHRYRPSSEFSVDGQLSYRETEFDRQRAERTFSRWEWSDYAFWRPRTENPLLVTGALRYLDSSVDVGDEELAQTSVTATVGASYQPAPRWQLAADASATLTDDNDAAGTRRSGLQRAEVRYAYDTVKLGDFNYNWFGSLQVGNEREDDQTGDVQFAETRLGHELLRSFWAEQGSPLRVRLRQEVSALEQTDGRSTQTLDHDLSLSWSSSGPGTSTYVGVTLSDSRTFGGGGRFDDEAREFQFINLQFSRNQQLGRESALSGNLTLQASRQVSPFDDSGGEFEPSASIDLSYRHQRAFGVPRLRFRSTLRIFSDSYLPLLDEVEDSTDYEGQIWDNRLEYSIGRLDLLLTARLSNIRERERGLIYFQLRRNFDTIFD